MGKRKVQAMTNEMKKKNREEARKRVAHMTEENEQEFFCAECEERQMFRKVKGGGWQCSVCGHWIADEFESESDEDTQIEELDWF
jgi:ribosomal protein L37AE/L43A